ncbi:hypothetical protein HHK36_014159 [Tetracentron sinense]|uniref:Uncharacterized protein n=1 Tax=Tetracentron sinense TaxID=13715 RepID=A0A834Z898_TETSI|nr:hypothetical protein HHK36_014159 [Tetracentron sinense]
MASSCFAFQVNGSVNRQSISQTFDHFKTSLSSSVKPFLKELQRNPMRIDVSKTMKQTTGRVLDAFVDSLFHFVDQPWLPSQIFQSNFAPVEEIGEAVQITTIEGKIPADFPEGIYIRNGSNPLFGDLKSTISMFGRSSHIWVEGEGMLHALYFTKDTHGNWTVSYKNKYVESETFKLEKQRNRPSFLPTVEGDSPAILAAYILNVLRFGTVTKHISNTNIFEHSGKVYTIAENYLPQEIDIFTLETYNDWDINGSWDRPFSSHPKRAPGTGELVIMGVDAKKPFCVLGIISADGKKLSHKVDLKFNKSILCHEVGVTQKYNVIMDYPLTVDISRVAKGGQLIKYDKEGHARIGVMPRYGDADSIRWFEVEPHCTFHLFNCFEDGDEMEGISEELIKVENHNFKENHFCSGAVFVSKDGGYEEDDGYIVSFVHDEDTNVSQVHIIDTKKFGSEPVAKITLPQRVPYGFHGTYIAIPTKKINKV